MEKNKRLFSFLEKKKIPYAEYGRMVGASRQQVTNWNRETHPVPEKFVLRTAELFEDFDLRWYHTGIYQGRSEELVNIDEYENQIAELTEKNKKLETALNETNAELLRSKDEVIALLRKQKA